MDEGEREGKRESAEAIYFAKKITVCLSDWLWVNVS